MSARENSGWLDETFESRILTRTQAPREFLPSSSLHQKDAKIIEIDDQTDIIDTVTFLVGGTHVVSGGDEGKIRCWRTEDGMEMGTPMDAGSKVCNIAVSQDGKWIVSGTSKGLVQVWNVENGDKLIEFQGHSNWVNAVDVSPDSTRIATGSDDNTASVWSLPTGQQLLGPWEHYHPVFAVKFSPNGRLVATAARQVALFSLNGGYVRIYDNWDGRVVADVPTVVTTLSYNQSLTWSSNSKQLFALSSYVFCLDASTGLTFSKWFIHDDDPGCIALGSNGTFIATSTESSVSFWDTTTHEKIGSVVEHSAPVESMDIFVNYDIVIGGGKKITLRSLYDVLPSSYVSSSFASRAWLVTLRLRY